jgi:spermidine synthase
LKVLAASSAQSAPVSSALAWRRRAALGLMLASGFAGLGYQIVWTQQCALWLGHESAAVLAVVAAFFGGLGLGSLTLGRWAGRSAHPARWYAALEVTIAVWSLVMAGMLGPISQWMLTLTGAQPSALWQWSVAFVGSLVLLSPATVAMGATLPAMERLVSGAFSASKSEGKFFAALYAGNTFGAVIGVLATALWLIPEWGLVRTAGACALLNVFCAAVAWLLAKPLDQVAVSAAQPSPTVTSTSKSMGLLWLLACTGWLGIGYEVLVVRVLSQVTENTVYTFALLLAVYLVGTALGAAIYQRGVKAESDDFSTAKISTTATTQRLLSWQAAMCLLGSWSLWVAQDIKQWLLTALGAGMTAALASEAALALVAFGPATVVMGMLFSHLTAQARAAGHSVGAAMGFNTLGAAVAPLCFGLLLAPAMGPKWALWAVVAAYAAAAIFLMRPLSLNIKLPLLWGVAAALVGTAVLAPSLAFIDVPEGGRVVSYRDGTMAAVSVVEDADGVSRLRINNRQQEGSSASLLADARQALLPLWLHPQPKSALFLGLGTGATVMSAAADAALQVDAVELLPEVMEAAAHFRSGFVQALAESADAPASGAPSNLKIMAADARRFVKTTAQRYDVIVSDNFHPARSGSGSLYTVEHFAAVRNRLSEQGVFCQWLPLHQLDIDTLRSIVRSFMTVYPQGSAMLATNSLETPVLGLVGRGDQPSSQGFDLQAVRNRLTRVNTPPSPAKFGVPDEWALLGNFIAGPDALKRFAGNAPLNTDDRPVVAYRAPRITYAPDSTPRERLFALLREVQIAPAELLAGTADDASQRRLAAYWAARNRFIEVGDKVQPSADVNRMLAQVREPLLGVLRISPDFRPAYDPLLRMAGALGRTDASAAVALLDELQRVQPARLEAAQLAARWRADGSTTAPKAMP